MNELDDFLDTLKIHNKDIDACFNDALAVRHLKKLSQNKGSDLAAPEPLATTEPDKSAQATIEDKLNDSVRETVDYLYTIKGDCSPELYQAIATLRQLINEEFKPRKSLSSQFIYDILNLAITTETTKARIEEAELIGRYFSMGGVPEFIEARLNALQKEQK